MSATEKVTLTLPKELMDAVRESASPRGHSKFVAKALQFYIEEKRRRALRERLIAGYQANASLDSSMALEWIAVEDESWQLHVPALDIQEESPRDTTTYSTR